MGLRGIFEELVDTRRTGAISAVRGYFLAKPDDGTYSQIETTQNSKGGSKIVNLNRLTWTFSFANLTAHAIIWMCRFGLILFDY
jgi:hypothetical protein